MRVPAIGVFGLSLALAGCTTGGHLVKSADVQLGQRLTAVDDVATGATYELTVYLISEGDSLEKIARQFGVSLGDLETLNPKLDPNRLQIGQPILVRERRHE